MRRSAGRGRAVTSRARPGGRGHRGGCGLVCFAAGWHSGSELVDDTIDFASDERGLPVRYPSDGAVPRDGVYIFAIPDADDILLLVSSPYRLQAGAVWPALALADGLDAAAGSWLRVVGVS
jgi:hypothetical protein